MMINEQKATHILIIEDDEDDFVLASDYLNEISFLNVDIVHASSAEEGIRRIQQDKFDLCLLDYQLGGVNGIEVLQQAMAIGFTAPIIMLTGQSDAALDQQALDYGAADYLIKNELTANSFARAIRYALARREVEQERIERHKAETENEAKNRFLAHLSHELRTPLTAILGYTELLMVGEYGQKKHKELDVILRNGRHLLSLLNGVLDLSKIVANKLELSIAPLSIENLIVDVFTLMQVPALDKGLSLSLEAASPIPLTIYSDATRLRQVIINLVSNAIKFTDEGEINIILKFDQNQAKSKFTIEIRDTGVGIREDRVNDIFQPFTQIEDVLSKSVGGSGLGLAISSELVQRLGGSINVKSEYGKGSCFTINIDPGDITEATFDTPDFKHTDLNYQDETPTKKLNGKVLVVDDLRDIRNLIGHMVQQFGLNVDFAKQGEEAVAMIDDAVASEKPFDLILMDIHMPEMDGKTATKLIRKTLPDLPVVALTAASMKGTDEILLQDGFTSVLSKPIDRRSLHSILDKYLQSSGGNQFSTEAETPSLSKKQVSKQVLVVEDDEDAANAIAMLLQSFAIDAVIANDFSSAKDKIFSNAEWDHILLDLHLGDKDGLLLAKEARNAGINTPISILSGEQPDSDRVNALNITQVLLKPIQLSALKAVLV